MEKRTETHELHFLNPRPTNSALYEMVKNHFDLEAGHYDAFDASSEKRNLYTSAINQLVAENLPKVDRILSVACGTGRRETEIRNLTQQSFAIYGVEISSEMARIATLHGIQCENANWLESHIEGPFDAALFLYAFGALPSVRDRLQALSKVRATLKPGAPLFLDVLNIDDTHEWGPRIKAEYANGSLVDQGYEVGDVLYSKIGDSRLAYWHYFSKCEIEELLRGAGFVELNTRFVGYHSRPGAPVGPTDGAIFIEAR